MRLKTLCLALAVVLVALVCASCALYRNDKMYVSDVKYEEARKIYDETGSLDLTRQKLVESETWRRAEINEAMYRLRKQHHLE